MQTEKKQNPVITEVRSLQGKQTLVIGFHGDQCSWKSLFSGHLDKLPGHCGTKSIWKNQC